MSKQKNSTKVRPITPKNDAKLQSTTRHTVFNPPIAKVTSLNQSN